jgi:beta-phosphoglucomutase-like phosphatase (HAD superfamily)
LLLQGLTDALRREGMPEGEVRYLTQSCHLWLAEAEREAVKSARATTGASGAIAGIVASGRSVRIVSNNSATAIMDYLCRDGAEVGAWRLDHVFGRPEDPSLMKPNPYLLLEALKPLGPLKTPQDCVFIGDASSDVVAAAEAGVNFIGFTGGVPRRRKRLLDAGVEPEVVIDGWADLGDLSFLL